MTTELIVRSARVSVDARFVGFALVAAFSMSCSAASVSSHEGTPGSGGTAASANAGGRTSAAGSGGSISGSGGAMSGSGATSSGGGSPSGGSGAAQSGTAGAAGESVYYQPTPTPVNFTGTGTFQTACDLHIATIGRIGPWGTSTIFNQWLTTRGATAATSLGDQVLTPALLAQYKIIVALNLAQFTIVWRGQTLDPYKSHAYSASEAQALAAWVTAGGGLMTTIGYTPQPAAEPANINFLLTFASMSYATSTNVSGDVSKWVAHPVTNGMGVARTDKGAQPLGAGQVVGWDISGDQTLRVNQVGSGKIVMWGDEWITYDPYWTNVTQLDIELLWVNIFNWLSPPAQCHLPLPPK